MSNFLIEFTKQGANGIDIKQFMVKAKSYELGCDLIVKHAGQPLSFKLLAVYEEMETDKKLFTRVL